MKKYGIIIGFLLLGVLTPESNSEYKGTICLVIDDFGYAHNETINGYFSLEKDFTVAIIPGHLYSESIGKILVLEFPL